MDKVECNPNFVQDRYMLCKNKLTLEERRKTAPIFIYLSKNHKGSVLYLPFCNRNSYAEPTAVLVRWNDIYTCTTHVNEPRC